MRTRISSILDFVHPGLDAAVWSADGKLLPQHKDLIMEKLTKWLNEAGLRYPEQWIEEIYIVGSLTTYQYAKDADLDVHVRVNLPAFIKSEKSNLSDKDAEKFLDDLRKAMSKDYMFLSDTEHPIEIYFLTPSGHDEGGPTGKYDLANDIWLKNPTSIRSDFDVEKEFPKFIEEAVEMAGEIDASLGTIERQVRQIEDLQDVIKVWTPDVRKKFQEKLDAKMKSIEDEIEALLKMKKEIVDARRVQEFDPLSEREIKFKYLQKFGYFFIISRLRDLLDADDTKVDLKEEDVPKIKEIVECPIDVKGQKGSDLAPEFGGGKLLIDFDNTIAHNNDQHEIEKPMDGVKEALEKLKAEGWEIIIYSGRADEPGGVDEIRKFMKEHNLPFDQIFVGKPMAEYIIDDHAIMFTNWNDVIKQVTKEAEQENNQEVKHDYSTTQFNMPKDVSQKIIEWCVENIPEEDLYDDESGRFSRALECHMTVLYGLLANEATEVEKLLADEKPVTAKFGKTIVFETPEKDALVIEIDCKDAVALHDKLKDLENEDQQPEYTPHVTVAYLKSGKGKKYADKDILGGEEVVLDTIKFNPKEGDPVFITLGQKKKASLDIDAYLGKAYWIDPNGKVYTVSAGATRRTTHRDWILKNVEMLMKKYGLPLENLAMVDDPNGEEAYDAMNAMFNAGWTRIGDSSTGDEWAVTLKDIQHIPSNVEDILMDFVPTGANVYVEQSDVDYGNPEKSVAIGWPPGNGLQEEVNYALRSPRLAASLNLVAFFIRKKAKLFWFTPEGQIEETFTIDPKQYGKLLSQGWIAIDDSTSPMRVLVYDLEFTPEYLDMYLGKKVPWGEDVVIQDRNGNHIQLRFPLKNIRRRIQRELYPPEEKAAAFQPSISTPAPDNDYQFSEGGDDVEIPVDPDPASDEETWEQGKYYDKPRKNFFHRIWDLITNDEKESVQKKADAGTDILKLMQETGGATYNLSQGNLAGTENYAVSIYPERSVILDHDPSPEEISSYVQKNSDLLQSPENSFGAWKSGGKTYLDVVVTMPDLEKAKALGAQHNQIAIFDLKNFVEIPTGGTGEVPKQSSMPLSKCADTNGYWLSPEGKEIVLSPTQEHAKVIRQYGLTWPEAITDHNWVRIRMDGDVAYIEVKDLKHVPAMVEDFIVRHPVRTMIIEEPHHGAWVEVNPNDMLESNLQYEINDELKRRRVASLEKTSYLQSFWVDPKGKPYLVTTNHAEWVDQNRELLEETYGLSIGEGNAIETPGLLVGDLLEYDWVRVNGLGHDYSYQVADLLNPPDALQMFLDDHYDWNSGSPILMDDLSDRYAEVDPTGDIKDDIKRALRRGRAASMNGKFINKTAVQQQDVADFYLLSLLPPEALDSKNVDPEHYDAVKIFYNTVMTLREEYIERGMAELVDEAETTQWVKDIPDAEMPDELKPYYKFHESGYSGRYSGDPDEEDEEEYEYSCEKCGQGLHEDDAYNFNENYYCEDCQADAIHAALSESAVYCLTHNVFVMPEWLKDELAWMGDFKNAALTEDHEHDGDNLVSYDEGISILREREKNEMKQLKLPLSYPDLQIRMFKNKDGNEFFWSDKGWVTDRSQAKLFTEEQKAQISKNDEEDGITWVQAAKRANLSKISYDSSYQGGPYWEAPHNFQDYTSMDFYKIFKYAPWKSQYGGPLWAEVARTIYEMEHTQDLQKLVVLIDHFHDLGHNTGKLLDKFPEWHEWFKRFLDRKAEKNSLKYLLQLASRPVRNLVMDYLRVHKHHWLDEVYDKQQAAGLSKYDIQKSAAPEYKNVLLICSGNTCRSPMAELILKHLRPDLNVISRGIYVSKGIPTAPEVEKVLKEKNIPYQEGTSSQVTEKDIMWADVILTMEDWQVDAIEDIAPNAIGKTFPIDVLDVPDPVGGDIKEYQKVRDQIQQALDKLSSLKTAKEVICPNCGKLREHEDIIQDGQCNLCKQEPKHRTTWDDPRQDMEPSKPLPTTFEWSTNDENMNYRYPWKFIRRPNGPDFSNENSVNDMLMEDKDTIASSRMPLSKTALSDFAAWIDPNGKIYDVRSGGKGGTHIGWIENNTKLLRDEYRYELPSNMEGKWLSSNQLSFIFDLLLSKGWVRIGDSLSHGISLSIQLADMRNIPSYVDDYLATVYEPGMIVEVEEGGDYRNKGRTVSLDNPFPTLQKAVNRALAGQLPMAAALSKRAYTSAGLWVAPDGKAFEVRNGGGRTHADWVVKNAKTLAQYGIADAKKRDYFEVATEMLNKGWVRIGDTARARGLLGVEVANIKNLPSYIDDVLASFLTDGEKIIVADLNDNWAEVTWPFRSLQTEVRKTFRRRANKENSSDSSKLPMLEREQLYAGNESNTYSDDQMEQIYDDQHADDMPDGNPGGGNVFHDWNQSTNDFPKKPTKPKFTLDQLTTPPNGTLPSYEVSWFISQPHGDDTE